jgi:hypothetical protein
LGVEKARRAKSKKSKPKTALTSSVGVTVAQFGDMWLLGDHRLLCADPQNDASYDRLLEGVGAEFVISGLPEMTTFNEVDCKSGAILIAAERIGRKARAIESNPAHVDAIIHRWQAETGKTAILAASGETFKTIKACRAV